mmetsp:Transcript_61959/g.200766  ORF Transcript_61959/g.200766 Transcript_61959/m.200766 type:complete len:227 (-) Transcript_61959:756-1436(-)
MQRGDAFLIGLRHLHAAPLQLQQPSDDRPVAHRGSCCQRAPAEAVARCGVGAEAPSQCLYDLEVALRGRPLQWPGALRIRGCRSAEAAASGSGSVGEQHLDDGHMTAEGCQEQRREAFRIPGLGLAPEPKQPPRRLGVAVQRRAVQGAVAVAAGRLPQQVRAPCTAYRGLRGQGIHGPRVATVRGTEQRGPMLGVALRADTKDEGFQASSCWAPVLHVECATPSPK